MRAGHADLYAVEVVLKDLGLRAPASCHLGELSGGQIQLVFLPRHLPWSPGCCYRTSRSDRLRAELIEPVMCYLIVDIKAICAKQPVDPQGLTLSLCKINRLTQEGLG